MTGYTPGYAVTEVLCVLCEFVWEVVFTHLYYILSIYCVLCSSLPNFLLGTITFKFSTHLSAAVRLSSQ